MKQQIKEEIKKEDTDNFNLNIEEMAGAGLCFGHKVSRLEPKMAAYVSEIKNTIHIINLQKTKEKLEEALRFIQQLVSEDKILLMVGTKIQIKDLVRDIALECGFFYINERWLGGTFTNFEQLKKRIEYFNDLENKKKNKELEKYSKKEKFKIDQEIQRLEIKFGGIKNLTRIPDAIFVVDMKKDNLAVKEAKMKGVKVIGIVDTNINPNLADYPIPANDDAISSVRYILEKIRDAVMAAKEKKKTQETKE